MGGNKVMLEICHVGASVMGGGIKKLKVKLT